MRAATILLTLSLVWLFGVVILAYWLGYSNGLARPDLERFLEEVIQSIPQERSLGVTIVPSLEELEWSLHQTSCIRLGLVSLPALILFVIGLRSAKKLSTARSRDTE